MLVKDHNRLGSGAHRTVAVQIQSARKVILVVVSIAATALVAVFVGYHWWPVLRDAPSAAQSCGFRYTVTHHVFVETKTSGEQISHQADQAHLKPLGETTELCITANAQSLFDTQLRSMAERDGKTQVWMTYYIGEANVGVVQVAKTFRVIFVREGDTWRRAGK
jgi:hypothetical protein